MAGFHHYPSEREQALMAAGVEPNPVVPLKQAWAAPNHRGGDRDGVYKSGVVVLAGDMLLEALNGDALAKQALKQQQARRKQMRIRQYTQQQLQHEAKIERMKWSAEHGMAGKKMKSTKVLVLRRQPELSSEQVGTMPENAFVHILEMAKPNEEGIRRALVQDTWGKNSGWCTVVDADGEANLVPADEPIVKPGHGGGMSWDVVPDDGARGGWMTRGFQGEMWAREHYPKHDQIPKQQEKDQRRTMQLNQFQQQQRRHKTEQAAGRRSNVKRVERHGGTPAAGRARPSAATAFRAARV